MGCWVARPLTGRCRGSCAMNTDDIRARHTVFGAGLGRMTCGTLGPCDASRLLADMDTQIEDAHLELQRRLVSAEAECRAADRLVRELTGKLGDANTRLAAVLALCRPLAWTNMSPYERLDRICAAATGADDA